MADELSYETLFPHVKRTLRDVWDPIGLGQDGPDDEYDHYIPQVVNLVRDIALFESAIAEYLLRIAAEQMRLVLPPGGATRTARALLGLREACRRCPDILVKQGISLDGIRCLWLFQRPDGLYSYEEASLVLEEDENGAWSSWCGHASGRSGLYMSAEEACVDARASFEWLRLGNLLSMERDETSATAFG